MHAIALTFLSFFNLKIMISVAENEIIKTQKKEREKIEISCIWCLCDDFSFLQQTFPLNVMFIFSITTAAVSFHWLLRQVIKTKNMAKTKNSNLNFNAFEKFAKEEKKSENLETCNGCASVCCYKYVVAHWVVVPGKIKRCTDSHLVYIV